MRTIFASVLCVRTWLQSNDQSSLIWRISGNDLHVCRFMHLMRSFSLQDNDSPFAHLVALFGSDDES